MFVHFVQLMQPRVSWHILFVHFIQPGGTLATIFVQFMIPGAQRHNFVGFGYNFCAIDEARGNDRTFFLCAVTARLKQRHDFICVLAGERWPRAGVGKRTG